MNVSHPLDVFLNPESVAIFGSMLDGWFFGGSVVVKDLQKMGYKGSIYPIHPSVKSICGLDVYQDITAIEGSVDLAVIITSYRHVPGILNKCGQKGTRAAIVISDCFAEIGEEGRKRQKHLLDIARSFSMRIIGPNTLGVFDTINTFTSIPYDKGYDYSLKGPISIITQTGMYGPQALALNDFSPGINKIVDLGNMCDIDETDCLEFLGNDPETRVISMYIEHTSRPRTFLKVAKNVSYKKPVLCLKSGRSQQAASAMASHTGSMAGDDKLYQCLFYQAGIIRVEIHEDLLQCAKAFAYQPLPKGNRLGIISFSGALGIQCIDTASNCGLRLGELSSQNRDKLANINQLLGNHPIDLGPAAATSGPETLDFYKKSYDILNNDESIDSIYLNTYVSSMLKPESYRDVLEYMQAHNKKPTVVWAYGTSAENITAFASIAESYRIPYFPTTYSAIKTLGYMTQYATWKSSRV
ncbi:MAG: CoA-binding protein [Deltaproteobacteria bacterium]|nr:CoA-binding protein [Deltaproteobacteria bacterium]